MLRKIFFVVTILTVFGSLIFMNNFITYLASIRIKNTTRATASTPEAVIVAKILGNSNSADAANSVSISNSNFYRFTTGDLGAPAKYKNKFWFAFGDSLAEVAPGLYPMTQFLVASTSDATISDGITLNDMVNIDSNLPYDQNNMPKSIIPSSSADNTIVRPIPNSLFVINWNGREYLFAHFLEGLSMSGNDHSSRYAGIALYNDERDVFEPYKQSVYFWPDLILRSNNAGDWYTTRSFQMADFTSDGTYLYIYGSPSGRYGGLQLGRIEIAKFMNAQDSEGFQYVRNDGMWSAPTTNTTEIMNMKWIITPKMNTASINPAAQGVADYYRTHQNDIDPQTNAPFYDFETYFSSTNQRVLNSTALTIGEFSVEYLTSLRKYLLITGRYGDTSESQGVFYYTADSPEGPWTEEGKLFNPPPRSDRPWIFYGPYTTKEFINETLQEMYLVGSTWEPSSVSWGGVYLLKTSLAHIYTRYQQPTPSPTPTSTLNEYIRSPHFEDISYGGPWGQWEDAPVADNASLTSVQGESLGITYTHDFSNTSYPKEARSCWIQVTLNENILSSLQGKEALLKAFMQRSDAQYSTDPHVGINITTESSTNDVYQLVSFGPNENTEKTTTVSFPNEKLKKIQIGFCLWNSYETGNQTNKTELLKSVSLTTGGLGQGRNQVDPTATPTPTPTPAPTPSPTVGLSAPPNTPTLSFSVRLQGISAMPRPTVTSIPLKITVAGGALSTPKEYTTQVTWQPSSGFWTGSIPLVGITIQTQAQQPKGYNITIKGPKHLAKRFCTLSQTAQFIQQCTTSGIYFSQNTISAQYTGDGDVLNVGDLPTQDGVFSVVDIQRLITNLGKPFPDADVNYDGIVNAMDWELMLRSMQSRYDE